LRKYYPIRAFGRCINENSSNPSQESYEFVKKHSKQILTSDLTKSLPPKCGRNTKCEQERLKFSTFYLSFESQTCSDYITEKFWRALSYGAIPVVIGPIKEHYSRIAPPSSFLYVDDFRTEQELAIEMFKISTNETEYIKYHEWRKYYDVKFEAEDTDPYRFCELCARLNTNKDRMWYTNVNDWFLDKCT